MPIYGYLASKYKHLMPDNGQIVYFTLEQASLKGHARINLRALIPCFLSLYCRVDRGRFRSLAAP